MRRYVHRIDAEIELSRKMCDFQKEQDEVVEKIAALKVKVQM